MLPATKSHVIISLLYSCYSSGTFCPLLKNDFYQLVLDVCNDRLWIWATTTSASNCVQPVEIDVQNKWQMNDNGVINVK